MLDPNVAQTLTMAVAATSSAASGDAGPASGAVSAHAEDPLPFAAVLRRHLAQPDDVKTAKMVRSLIDAQAKTEVSPSEAKATEATPQTDLLAWLAPLMASVAVQSSTPDATSGQEGETASSVSADPGFALPVPIAAPVLPGSTPAAPALPADGIAAETTVPASSPQGIAATLSQEPSSTNSDLAAAHAAESPGARLSAQPAAAGIVPETPAQPSAILAAAEPAAAESAGQTGNGSPASTPVQISFDTVLSAAHGAAATAARAHQATAHAEAKPITTPVGAHGWDAEVGDKLAWMVGRQETRAELVLNPPQMGRIEVSLSINGNQANALFVSANPAVREALENAVPQLRESLQGAGIALGQAQVGAESFRQPSAQGREKNDNSPRGEERGIGSASVSSTAEPALRRGNGLIDTFA